MRTLAVSILLLVSISAAAQKKEYWDTNAWGFIKVNYAPDDKSVWNNQILIRRHIVSDIYPLSGFVPANQIEFFHFLSGYTYNFTEHWQGHGSLRYRTESGGDKYVIPRFYIRHIGISGKLSFIKQLMVERMQFIVKDRTSSTRFRGLLGFSYSFLLAQKNLTPLVSMEVFKNTTPGAKRFFSNSRLRLDINYELSPKLTAGLFVMRDTRRSYLDIEVFDAEGNKIQSKGPVNYITPTYGFIFTCLIKKKTQAE